MAWGFLDWVRGRPRERDADELMLSPNASARELKEVALLIPTDPRGYKAYQLLDQQKERARPVLERLFQEDARFRSMEGEVAGWGKPPLEMVLTVLVRWHSDLANRELAG